FFAHPGQSSIEYISGKRNAYQKPVSYFLIWTGLYILTHNAIIHYHHLELTTETIAQLNIREQSNLLFRQHFTLFILPVILLSAWLLYLILGRRKYNFIEILTLSLYGGGTYFMMSWISDIVLGMIFQINILSLQVFFWQMIMSSTYNLWFSFDFFKRSAVRFFWIRLILASLSIAFGGWVIMFYLPMLWLKLFNG
ncbi:MAG TPA: DUF3667 domain-containing protein, partial [Saprospiraceae bacterium]|nr:DUF3667 domain-containing protein [Saprospiraceae bacterium]